MKQTRSIVLSMRLPVGSGRRLKRLANRHGWTPSDASARLVEEGLRRSEFAFLDFRDSPAGRPISKEAPWRYGKSCCFSGATKEMSGTWPGI
jgi:hypothetical protein